MGPTTPMGLTDAVTDTLSEGLLLEEALADVDVLTETLGDDDALRVAGSDELGKDVKDVVDVVEGDAPSLREPVGEPDIEDDEDMLMLMLGDCEAEEDTLV